jgi:hypothetical protein
VQGLIFGKPTPEHVTLSAQLFDLSFERVDPIFGFTPRRGESMNVGVCTALREG